MRLDDLLARAERLELKSRFLARSRYAGLYQSAFRGQGMEFADVREYADGDDVRLIEWNVSARSQALYVKRMVEERERNVLVVLDTSGSLDFGTVRCRKFDVLAELAGILILSAFLARDRVSLACFGSKVDLFVPSAKGWTHAARLIREVAARQPAGTCGKMESLWNFLNSPCVPRSLAFLLTDFQAPAAPSNALSVVCRKHELVVMLVSDPREWKLPKAGRLRVRDPESGQAGLINTNREEVRSRYEQALAARRTELLSLLRGSGAAYVEFSTGADYEMQLRRFFEARATRGRS